MILEGSEGSAEKRLPHARGNLENRPTLPNVTAQTCTATAGDASEGLEGSERSTALRPCARVMCARTLPTLPPCRSAAATLPQTVQQLRPRQEPSRHSPPIRLPVRGPPAWQRRSWAWTWPGEAATSTRSSRRRRRRRPHNNPATRPGQSAEENTMAAGDTQITIAGNLVDEPELRFTPVSRGSGLLRSRLPRTRG
jgi:hypothetical protein